MIAAATAEPATHNKRAYDPGKTCHCGKTFFRRVKEALSDYRKRETCSPACRREALPGSASEVSVTSYIRRGDFTCSNCNYFREDSELGKNCGPCTTGQNFKMKRGDK